MVKSARPVWPVGKGIERVAVCFFGGLYVVVSKVGECREYQKEVAAACKRAARVQSHDEIVDPFHCTSKAKGRLIVSRAVGSSDKKGRYTPPPQSPQKTQIQGEKIKPTPLSKISNHFAGHPTTQPKTQENFLSRRGKNPPTPPAAGF